MQTTPTNFMVRWSSLAPAADPMGEAHFILTLPLSPSFISALLFKTPSVFHSPISKKSPSLPWDFGSPFPYPPPPQNPRCDQDCER